MNTEINKKEIITQDLMTIPNAISFIRIILITPFVAFFLGGMYIPAAITVGLSGLSDCFDGMIARKLHQESEIGKILDPLADKLTLIAVGVCLIFIEPFVLPVMILMIIKDALMLIGGSIIIKRGVVPPKSLWYGKVSTILFYFSVAAIVMMAVLDYTNRTLTLILLGVTLVFMIYSLINYAIIFFRIIRDLNSGKKPVD
jgi:cardiolipin synthase